MATGIVVYIHIALQAGSDVIALELVRAVPGRGLEGDRYFTGVGTYSENAGPDHEVTLIEEEAVATLRHEHRISLEPGESRRNIMTRGVALNPLVGKEFQVGKVRLRGVRLCEPCAHLEGLTSPGVLRGLVNRGGLRAEILNEGIICIGDPVAILPVGL